MDTIRALLDRPIYQVNEAARLLGLPDKTLRRWLDGDKRFGTIIEPLIRDIPTGSWEVTWGEFVEAGFLSGYRHKQLPMESLRPLMRDLRDRLQTKYPLVEARPLYSDGRELLWQEQSRHDLHEDLLLVVRGRESDGYQLVLTDVAKAFVERVEFEPDVNGVAARWFPLGRGNRRITLDPQIAFGLPTINGVRTEAIAELADAGETVDTICDVYGSLGVTRDDIDTAIAFEHRLRVAA
ncbi:MAG: DUF433 domain-containing protein [Acidimicrobiia bacterium]